MIEIVDRKNIPEDSWNQLIRENRNRVPYGFSWVLDCLGPWEALINEDQKWVLPLPFNQKIPFWKQSIQPYFAQQLGFFGALPEDREFQLIQKTLRRRYWRLIWNIPTEQTKLFKDFKMKQRTNYQLSLHKPYEEIRKNYGKSLRKRIRKHSSHLIWEPITNWGAFTDFYRKEIGHKSGLPNSAYQNLQRLFQEANKQNALIAEKAIDPVNGEVVLQSAVLRLGQYLVNLFGASNSAGRELCAMHLFLDRIIERHAGTDWTLDFEGSDIPGVAQFFASYGSVPKPYAQIRKDFWKEGLPF
jgi:hypothetical protein